MSHRNQNPKHLADPLSLHLLHAAFRLADEEFRRRADGRPRGRAKKKRASTRGEAARLTAALKSHVASLDLESLERLRVQLAGSLLQELDRRMTAPGSPPGEPLDEALIPAEPEQPAPHEPHAGQRVGLVSLPWMSPAMPSIQLATLASALEREGIASDVHELYVDYAARIGLNLYNTLGNLLGYVPEWVFSRHYYGPEHGDDLSAMLGQPLDEVSWPEYADVMLEALEPVTRDYLDAMIEQVDWSQYDVIGCSLTISQLGASMAFARRVKLLHPDVKFIFGGSQCAGPMGRAILRICPYVDVVVHVEGELVLGELVRRLRRGETVEGMAGVSCRGAGGAVVSGEPGGLYRTEAERLPLSYDAYFRRLVRLGLTEKMRPWLPFEGSRGCWYGQKVQCTFCGLHEIMEFRAWPGDAVLAELERLYARYGIGRFYAMDLILPREYLHTFLPEVARRGHRWMFFWEIKSNVRREELEVLAAAGVSWVQPGVESLDADLLRLMKKGVSALQNILLLKWCDELSIYCGWNLLFGLPGETARSYERMNEIIPKLYHLTPPSGGGQFQLHRFSPYFDRPGEFGIRWTGAHPMFRFAFPVPQEELNELVYLHEFVYDPGAGRVDHSATEEAVRRWREAHARGASLRIDVRPDGTSRIVDTRRGDSPRRSYRLSAAATALYLFLDAGIKETAVADAFLSAHPAEADALGGGTGVSSVVGKWLGADLVLAVDGRVVSLALHPQRAAAKRAKISRRTIDAILQSGSPAQPEVATAVNRQ